MGYNPSYSCIVPESTAISHSLLKGQRFTAKFGYNKDIDAGVEETIWAAGGEFNPFSITGAETLSIVSSDAADTNTTGTGAWLIAIFGLDENYNEVEELTLALNGTTPVTSVNSYRAINRVAVSYSGSGQKNAGTITLTQSSSGLTLASIPIGESVTQQCIYTVPAGYTAFLRRVELNLGKTGGGANPKIEGEVYSWNPLSNTRYNVSTFILDSQRQNNIIFEQPFANPTASTNTITINATSDTANTEVFCRFFMDVVLNK